MLTAEIHGENDHQNMGTLVVYNSNMSGDDELTALSVEGITSTAEDAEAAELSTYASRPPRTTHRGRPTLPGASPERSLGRRRPSPWTRTVSDDATYTVQVGAGASVAGGASGATVELPYNATGSATTGPLASTITIEVTAENGYNDHTYTFSVSRAAPVGYALASDRCRRQCDRCTDGLTVQSAWTATTANADTETVEITVDSGRGHRPVGPNAARRSW